MRLQDGRRIEWQGNECFLLLTDAKMHDTSFAAYVLWVAGVWPSIWSFDTSYINWMKLHFADIQATVPRKSWRGLLFGVGNKSIQWRTWESLEFESSKAGRSHREIENRICRIYIYRDDQKKLKRILSWRTLLGSLSQSYSSQSSQNWFCAFQYLLSANLPPKVPWSFSSHPQSNGMYPPGRPARAGHRGSAGSSWGGPMD